MKQILTILTNCLLLCAQAFAAAEKPNILVIYADDLGYGDVQCNNPERGKIPTPNIGSGKGVRNVSGTKYCFLL